MITVEAGKSREIKLTVWNRSYYRDGSGSAPATLMVHIKAIMYQTGAYLITEQKTPVAFGAAESKVLPLTMNVPSNFYGTATMVAWVSPDSGLNLAVASESLSIVGITPSGLSLGDISILDIGGKTPVSMVKQVAQLGDYVTQIMNESTAYPLPGCQLVVENTLRARPDFFINPSAYPPWPDENQIYVELMHQADIAQWDEELWGPNISGWHAYSDWPETGGYPYLLAMTIADVIRRGISLPTIVTLSGTIVVSSPENLPVTWRDNEIPYDQWKAQEVQIIWGLPVPMPAFRGIGQIAGVGSVTMTKCPHYVGGSYSPGIYDAIFIIGTPTGSTRFIVRSMIQITGRGTLY